MKIFSLIACLFIFLRANTQKVDDLDTYKIDTLQLYGPSTKKIVVFTNGHLQFFLDYQALKDSSNLFIKRFKKIDKVQTNKVAPVIKYAKKQFSSSDTAWMRPEDYDFIGFHFVEKFIASQLDIGKLSIRDAINRKSIGFVLRVTGRFIKGPLNAWAGRRYYLIGQSRHFAIVTTSQS